MDGTTINRDILGLKSKHFHFITIYLVRFSTLVYNIKFKQVYYLLK